MPHHTVNILLIYLSNFITGGGKSRGEVLGTSDEDSLNDNNSVISLNSDGTYLDDGGISI